MAEKLYTKQDYIKACEEANTTGKIVTLVQKEVEYDVKVLEWNKKTIEVQKYDEEGNPMYDDDGNPIMEEIKVDDYDNPIMVEEEIINPITGKKEIVTVQKYHTETRTKTVEEIVLVDDDKYIERNFFPTSLGFVSRTVHMKDGTEQSFLKDVLANLVVGAKIVTYTEAKEKQNVEVTEQFINECKQQYFKDFYGE